ncbi:MAG: hypothetical protein RL596_2463 [Bacteroidota bacterium]|jgi:hypothetical protein
MKFSTKKISLFLFIYLISFSFVFSQNKGKLTISFPKKGYQTFYLDLKYKGPNGGTYATSTSVYVTDGKKVL